MPNAGNVDFAVGQLKHDRIWHVGRHEKHGKTRTREKEEQNEFINNVIFKRGERMQVLREKEKGIYVRDLSDKYIICAKITWVDGSWKLYKLQEIEGKYCWCPISATGSSFWSTSEDLEEAIEQLYNEASEFKATIDLQAFRIIDDFIGWLKENY